MKDYNISKNPYPICKECGQPIIFSVRVPPIKRTATHQYNLYRIFCIVDAMQGVCRKCHTKHLLFIKDDDERVNNLYKEAEEISNNAGDTKEEGE